MMIVSNDPSNIFQNGTKTSFTNITHSNDSTIPSSEHMIVGDTISSSSNINSCYGVTQNVKLTSDNTAVSTTALHINNNCIGVAAAAGIATGLAVTVAPEIAAIAAGGAALTTAINN